MVSGNADSVAVMRFAVEASDDGAAQAGPRSVFLFIVRVASALPPVRDSDSRRSCMTTQLKLAAPLASSFVYGCIGFGALHAQTKISPAFWVTETLEVSDQAAFLNVIKAVPGTLQPFGGQYIVLGGKIASGEGSP